jgi:hypothetical protein
MIAWIVTDRDECTRAASFWDAFFMAICKEPHSFWSAAFSHEKWEMRIRGALHGMHRMTVLHFYGFGKGLFF